jgi:hypothetical protein
LSKQTSKQGRVETKQQGDKNDWKQKALLNINTGYKWPQCPIKRQRIESVFKNKTQPNGAYKRLFSLKNINTDLESKGGKKIFLANDPKNTQM